MSDINYDSSICRNIMVDARYILFIIDKFADAGHLVEEMKLVHPRTDRSNNDKMKQEKYKPVSGRKQQLKLKNDKKGIDKNSVPSKEQKVIPYNGGGGN